jgi:hypothetical protein
MVAMFVITPCVMTALAWKIGISYIKKTVEATKTRMADKMRERTINALR